MMADYTGPTQENFVTQIEADLLTDHGESDAAAKSDEAASKAYFKHLGGETNV